MKKFFLFIISVLSLAIILTGCSVNLGSQVNKGVKKSSVSKGVVSYYQKLSKSDKKKIKFKFSEDQDETQSNYADPVYAISVKITNNSNKTVKFDESKFIVFVDETSKFIATKNKIITLKPGKTISINQLIENVGEQALVGNESYFIYMNNDNKLAKTLTVVPKNNNAGTTSSDNTQGSQAGDTSSDDNQQTQTDDTTSDSSQSTQDNTSNVPDPKEAYEKLGIDDTHPYSDMHLYRVDGVWTFDDDWGLSWLVYDDGRIKGPGDPKPIWPGE